MTSGSFHSRNAGAAPSSSPKEDRCEETATGTDWPVAGSTAVVRPITGPWTVRSTWMVSSTGGSGEPGDGFPSWTSVRSYIGVQTPLNRYAVLADVGGEPSRLQSFSIRWSMMSAPADVRSEEHTSELQSLRHLV